MEYTRSQNANILELHQMIDKLTTELFSHNSKMPERILSKSDENMNIGINGTSNKDNTQIGNNGTVSKEGKIGNNGATRKCNIF